jgi:hypothetical protein
MSAKNILTRGFIAKAKKTAGDRHFPGRFTCHDVQLTGDGEDLFATFTLTAEELAAAAESQLVWTDQDVQRGIRPDATSGPPRELPVGAGYPDPNLYIFDAAKADDIAEKLLRGDKLFLSPLVWNLRPGTFEAYWNDTEKSIHIYSGRIYLPDSHHRQQAILKAILSHRESPSSYPRFSPTKQFKIELYFLSKEDEGNYFFDKNQRPQPASKSKAYDLTTLDDLSLLAKKVIEKSAALKDNVNRVTDRLTAKNSQVMTLSTLREMMKSLTHVDALDEPEIDGLAKVAATFYDLLAEIRPELGRVDQARRKATRDRLIVDAAVMMHGYASLMGEFNDAISTIGMIEATKEWRIKLEKLAPGRRYSLRGWAGDIFEKQNPLWQRVGVVKPGRDGTRLTVLNTGAARSECGRVLRQIVSTDKVTPNLAFLIRR